MVKLRYFFLATLFLFSCKTQNKISSSENDEETKLLISYIQVNESGGNEPDYKLEVYSNRQMYLTANKNLDKQGKYLRTVQEKEFENLLQSFSKSDFFEFDDEYTSEQASEPTIYLYYTSEGKEKKVKHQTGAPDDLQELEFMMQSFLDRVGWEKMSW